jgi:hypothetical protein
MARSQPVILAAHRQSPPGWRPTDPVYAALALQKGRLQASAAPQGRRWDGRRCSWIPDSLGRLIAGQSGISWILDSSGHPDPATQRSQAPKAVPNSAPEGAGSSHKCIMPENTRQPFGEGRHHVGAKRRARWLRGVVTLARHNLASCLGVPGQCENHPESATRKGRTSKH